MIKLFLKLILVLALVCLRPSVGLANSCTIKIVNILSEIQGIEKSPYDISHEVELYANEEAFAFVTTPNGKVSGLFGKMSPPREDNLPEEVVKFLKKGKKRAKKKGRDINYLNMDFNKLPINIKKELILLSTRMRNQNAFHEDRIIHGLKFIDSIEFFNPKEQMIFGKLYPAGKIHVNLKDVLAGSPVEFGSPEALKNMESFEFHFRNKGKNSSEFYSQLNEFLKLTKITKLSEHAHLVIPAIYFDESPLKELNVFNLVDFHRRLNTITELEAALVRGKLISTVVDEDNTNITYWDALSSEKLKQLYLDMFSGKFFKKSYQNTTFKMAFVGIRSPGLYKTNDDSLVFGFEFRSLGQVTESTKLIFNMAQKNVVNGTYGLPRDFSSSWINQKYNSKLFLMFNVLKKKKIDELILRSHYNQAIFTFKKYLNDHYLLKNFKEKELIKVFNLSSTLENKLFKYLVHNFEYEPLLHNNKTMLNRIKKEQIKALKAVLEMEEPTQAKVNSITKKFIEESGYLELLLRSFKTE